MTIRWLSLFLLLIPCSLGGQQGVIAVPGEPTNLDAVKQQLKQYQSCKESNCYVPQLERQADLAITFLKQSVESYKPGEKLAIVLDIDETALSNWAVEAHDDFGYIPNETRTGVSRFDAGKRLQGRCAYFVRPKRIM